ncbi:hypothetical protein, partial [Sphingopyxis sp.]|uniref:hypothetical protein n=1 Tax=Sphingopyxis sp. TaxID=1908224 RepID=UPI0035AFCDF5
MTSALPWIPDQVRDDEGLETTPFQPITALPNAMAANDRCSPINHRHPGLDPGSTTSALQWIPDQVR